MADRGVGSSLRRLCASTGALVALGLVLAVSAAAAAPSPDPPPAPPAPPKTEPVQPTVTVVVRQAPVVTPAPVVQRPTPVRKAPVQRAKPKPAPAKVAPVVKPKAKAPAPVARPPHDRYRVPLAAFVASPSADSVDRDLLALAGFGLLLVAMGGAVVLFAARRQLALACARLLLALVLVPSAERGCATGDAITLVGTSRRERLAHERRHDHWTVRRQTDLEHQRLSTGRARATEGRPPRTCKCTFRGGHRRYSRATREDRQDARPASAARRSPALPTQTAGSTTRCGRVQRPGRGLGHRGLQRSDVRRG